MISWNSASVNVQRGLQQSLCHKALLVTESTMSNNAILRAVQNRIPLEVVVMAFCKVMTDIWSDVSIISEHIHELTIHSNFSNLSSIGNDWNAILFFAGMSQNVSITLFEFNWPFVVYSRWHVMLIQQKKSSQLTMEADEGCHKDVLKEIMITKWMKIFCCQLFCGILYFYGCFALLRCAGRIAVTFSYLWD